MIYVGMDVSSKSFEIYAINGRKKIVKKGAIKPTKQALRTLASELSAERCLFVFEAGNQLKWIADTLKKIAHVDIHVVHPNEIKWISQSSGKTDKVDAKKLAELARMDALPRAVRVVEGAAREMRELASARIGLLSKRVSLINTIRGLVKQEDVHLPEKFFRREDWREALRKSKLSKTVMTIVESYMIAVDALLDAEAQVTGELCAVKDARVDLVETVPALGKISARVVVGALDDAKRFDSRKQVAKYGALTPRIYQSGDVTRLGRITSDGRGEVRRVLLQCAHTVARMKSAESKPLRDFYERVMKRSGKKRALIALSRKLLTTVYGVLKSGKPYDARCLMAA